MTTVVRPTSSVDQIRADHLRGLLTHADATEALRRLGVANPALFVPPPCHRIFVAPSPLLKTRRPM